MKFNKKAPAAVSGASLSAPDADAMEQLNDLMKTFNEVSKNV